MNFVHRIFNKSISNKIARKGIGPLIPSTTNSFLSGSCTECGQPISDFTIFGNALVLCDNGTFKIKCSDCRIGNQIKFEKPKVLRGSINKNIILIDLNERIVTKSISWIEMMTAWRKNYGIFQDEKRYSDAYKHKEPIQNYFGKIEMLESCGECGAFWSNDFMKDKIKDLIREGKCLSCGIPHHFQWNMRTTFNNELKKININLLM